jgi:hypothetical protein
LLGHLATSPPKWDETRKTVPAGTLPGFLTALRRAIGSMADSSTPDRAPSLDYVFNSQVYELAVRRVKPLGRSVVGLRTFDHLMRADLSIRNLRTLDVTRFAITYDPDAAGARLPIQIFYQPGFWTAIELSLDDAAEAPPDPAGDQTRLEDIRRICHFVES